jgi:chemotaxis protein CheD
MIAWFIDKGAYPAELEVKVFGGSDILVTGPDRRNVSVGKQNIEAARQALLREGLKLHASHIGGTSGRKIIFSTQTGEVLMKRIRKTVHIEEDLCRRQALKQEY